MALVLIDPHTVVRQALCSLFADHDIPIAAETADGLAAVAIAGKLRPDVVLTEVALEPLTSADITRRVLAASPQTCVIALSGCADRAGVAQMIDAGASGYVLKEDPFENLLEALEAVTAGQTYFSAKLLPIVAARDGDADDGLNAPGETLAEREREVLCLLADGATVKQAAAALQVSTKTIETYRTRIMKKLGLAGVAALTRYAVRTGLVRL